MLTVSSWNGQRFVGLLGFFFLFPFHTHTEELLKETGNLKRNIRFAARYVQKILLFMLIHAYIHTTDFINICIKSLKIKCIELKQHKLLPLLASEC